MFRAFSGPFSLHQPHPCLTRARHQSQAAAGGHVAIVERLIHCEDIDIEAIDAAGQSALEVVNQILSDDFADLEEYKSNLERIREKLSPVSPI